MQTSYYAGYRNGEGAVAISQGVPAGFRGRIYNKLAPSLELIRLGKTGQVEEFIRRYKAEVLDNLDAAAVAAELGEDAVLLCWERPGEFCHRRLVAEWFEEKLGAPVPEFSHSTSSTLQGGLF